MELSTGPDIRWAVELSDGKMFQGSRMKVLLEAVAAWGRDVQVVKWTVPGTLEVNRNQRRERVQKDYEDIISRLAHHAQED